MYFQLYFGKVTFGFFVISCAALYLRECFDDKFLTEDISLLQLNYENDSFFIFTLHAVKRNPVFPIISRSNIISYKFKAGVNMNRREIWSDIKKEIVRIKMDWKHYQTVDPRKREPQIARGLFGIRLLILHFKFQFSKSIKSSTFHIFLNLTCPLRKNISFPKRPKIPQKFTQNRQTVVNEMSREI